MQFAALILLLTAGADAPRAAVDYTAQIKPILTERCLACHGALKQEGGLRLDTGASARAGGDSGPALVPGNADDSLLLQRVSATDLSERMPPEGKPLTAGEIALLTAWVRENATSPADEQPEPDPREHWAFRPVERLAVPTVADTRLANNAIDAFIAAEHERRGLVSLAPARPELLLRRVYLDLIGLPPTRNELRAWLRDPSPAAYAAVVDDLLNRPQYGERWARHWMDVWRYSDWYGRRHVPDVWNSAPQVWRWRDWIVNSLNRDHGYDRMVREMLAADEIVPEDYEAAVATDYLVRNWYALNPNQWMRDNVEHTGKAFLGLMLNCAHCHDHKYDPILQDEYFGFRAFFEPIDVRQDRVVGEPEPGPFVEYQYSVLRKIERLGSVKVYDKRPDAPTWFYTGGDERNRVESRGSIAPAVPAFLPGASIEIQPVELPPIAYYPGLRPAIQQQEIAAAAAAVTQAEQALAAARSTAQAESDELAVLKQRADEAEAALIAAREAGGGALQGQQSLLLDATNGRRIINNPLANVFALDSGAELRLELLVLKDAHFNVQLAKDTQAGLTAGCVAFENGAIQSYRPGSFDLFQAGSYDVAAGQTRLEMTLELDRDADQCLLTVRSVGDDQVLVDQVPVALNGWNPAADPQQAITLDARPGAVVAVDNLIVQSAHPQSDGTGILTFDFEQPLYADGQEIVGAQGWVLSSFAQAGATSQITASLDTGAVLAEREAFEAARSVLALKQLPLAIAEQQLAAAQAHQASLHARIAADRVRYGFETGDADALTREASIAERTARVAQAEVTLAIARLAKAQAEQLPADNADRGKQLEAAGKQLSDAAATLASANSALADPAQATAYTPLSPVYPTQSTGRRRALAEWIASDQNPLTPRVAVNHIWLRHFQSAIVDTVYNFGRNGAPPTHPDLINWLAAELMDNNWSMKHLHRLIVMSAAYRRQSGPVDVRHESLARNIAIDPDNRWLWRMNASRMEAEVVRDSILSVAGTLDLTLGGQELENADALRTNRRSLYYAVYPEAGGMSEFGKLFDAPDPTECYRRTKTVVPQQALALTNSDLIHAQSGAIAARLRSETADAAEPDREFITAAFEAVLTRTPTDAELARCDEFLELQEQQAVANNAADPVTAARASLVRALFNHNDFVTVR